MPQHKTWWRNFRVPQPIEVTVGGVTHLGTAVAVESGRKVHVDVTLDA